MADPVTSVLERIAEDAAFLWSWRDRAVRAPNMRLLDLVRLDERLEAHLDALRVAGPVGCELARAERRHGGPGAVFVIASLITTGESAVADLAALIDEEEEAGRRALISALAWAPRAIAQTVIAALLAEGNAVHRAMALAIAGCRRADPGAALAAALEDAEPAPRSAAVRTAALLGRRDLAAVIAGLANDADPACTWEAARAALHLGADTSGVVARIADEGGSRAPTAQDLLLRRLALPAAHGWLRALAKRPERTRDLIAGAGTTGDPVYVPWLIARMEEPQLARAAGAAFCLITGVDLAYRDLDRRAPDGFEGGPTDDPADPDVTLDPDEGLPWPDPARIQAWWSRESARFPTGVPHLLGAPKRTLDHMRALNDATQNQRHAVALELALARPERVMFEVRARGRHQRQMLHRAAA